MTENKKSNHLKVAVFDLIIIFVLVYTSLNVSVDGLNHGVLFLGVSVALYFAMQILELNLGRAKIKKSLLLIAVFVGWASIKTMIDTMNTQELISITIGSEGGIFYFLLMGIMVSRGMKIINERIVAKKKINSQVVIVVMAIWLVLLFNFKNFIEYLGDIRHDVFLINDQDDYYQRFASYLIIQNIMCGYMIMLLGRSKEGINVFLFYVGLIGYVLYAIVSMVKSQLVGSNSAFAFAFGYMLIVFFSLYIRKKNLLKCERASITTNILSKNLVVAGLAFVAYVAFVSILIVAYIKYLTDINLEVFRILGYGEGEVSSITSRLKIVSDNFMTHLSHSPLIGNTQVDSLTTGKGTYIHSTISIVTHLGIIGFFIFALLVIKTYRNISIKKFLTQKKYIDNTDIILFNKFIYIYVLIVGFAIAFYTWAPLWFIIGFYCASDFSRGD